MVNLAKGASGFPRPVRVSGEEVSVGPFVSESDDEERFREREETKRLMYVALTRARDRLYLGTVLKDGAFAVGRGSLADVLPESFRAMFVRAAMQQETSIGWTAQSGREYRFRLPRPAVPHSSASRLSNGVDQTNRNGIAPRHQPATDFFEPLIDPGGVERVPVTQALDADATPLRTTEFPTNADEALVGTLVHRLFQFSAELPDLRVETIAGLAGRLIRPEERATAANAGATLDRAISAWSSMRAQPGLDALLASGDRIHELPFSCVSPEAPNRVLRGTIDCLVRSADGTITVIEFKTGAPSPAHQAQLDVYLEAARALFPGAAVAGRIIYPR